MKASRATDHKFDVQQFERAYQAEVAKSAELEGRLAGLRDEVAVLRDQVAHRRGFKSQVKQVLVALDASIQARLYTRGRVKRHKPRAVINPSVLTSKDKVLLVQAALAYDANSFFRYHAHRSELSFRYRAASKLYRLARGAAVYSLRKANGLRRRMTA